VADSVADSTLPASHARYRLKDIDEVGVFLRKLAGL
jgi:hypothetical protein